VRKELQELIPEINKYLAMGEAILGNPEALKEFRELQAKINKIRETPEEPVIAEERKPTFRSQNSRKP